MTDIWLLTHYLLEYEHLKVYACFTDRTLYIYISNIELNKTRTEKIEVGNYTTVGELFSQRNLISNKIT